MQAPNITRRFKFCNKEIYLCLKLFTETQKKYSKDDVPEEKVKVFAKKNCFLIHFCYKLIFKSGLTKNLIYLQYFKMSETAVLSADGY